MRHDLQSLRLFVLAAEEKSLTRAAERMHLAVSAASRRIKLMEEEAGLALFRRLAHGIEPTPAGLTTLQYAREVLRLGDQLRANLADHGEGVRGRVRVFASSSALVQRLARDLAAFAFANPEIKLDLEEQPTLLTLEALQRNQAQLGVIVRGISTEGFVTYPYAQDRLVVAAAPDHPLAARGSIRFSQLLDEDLVSLDAGTATYRLLAEQAREIGRFMKLRVQVRSFDVMCQMIHNGLGVGILPEAALMPLARGLGLSLIRLEETWAERHLDLCIPSLARIDPPTARLLTALLAASTNS